MDRLTEMLEMQRELQKKHMKDGDPALLTGDEMATFMTWNFAAMVKELSEATDEIGWKPWATSRHINEEAFLKEMVDAFHFFMNMMICGAQGLPSPVLAEKFFKLYQEKNAVNAQRQIDGYDGVTGKCPECHRELTEVDIHELWTEPFSDGPKVFCSHRCSINYILDSSNNG